MNFPAADCTIAVSQGQYLYKVNASTGTVQKVASLPTGISPPKDSNYDGMNAFADGTLVLKTQNRIAGCTNQGYNFIFCANQSQAAPSVVAAVDPNTFEVLDWEQLPEMIGGRNTVTQFQGKDYLYLFGTTNAFRYEWNDQNLTLDTNWGPVPYLLAGPIKEIVEYQDGQAFISRAQSVFNVISPMIPPEQSAEVQEINKFFEDLNNSVQERSNPEVVSNSIRSIIHEISEITGISEEDISSIAGCNS